MRHRIVALGAALALAALAGCADNGASPSAGAGTTGGGGQVASGEPEYGGTLVYLANTEPPTWDSFRVPSLNVNSINSSVFDTVIAQAEDGSYKPQLAESWEVSDDATVYTLKLKQGITFHDGTAFDAAVLKQNLDRAANEPDLSLSGTIKENKVIDDHTLEVTLAEPTGGFLHQLSTPHIPIYSGRVLSEHDSAEIGANPLLSVGTGPFKVADYEKGSKIVLERFEDYNWAPETWEHQGKAYLDRVEISFVPDTQSRVGSLNSGQADAIDQVPPLNIPEVEGAGNQILRKDNAGTPWYLALNPNIPPFDDRRVREAFRSSIDVQTLLNSVYGGEYIPAWSTVTPPTPPEGSYNEALEKSWSYDPDQAGDLLEEAGYADKDADGYYTKDGQRLHIDWYVNSLYAQTDQRDVLGEAIAAALNQVGWEVERHPFDTAAHSAALAKNEHNLADASRGFADPGTGIGILASRSDARKLADGINYGLVSDAKIDELYEVIRTSADSAARVEASRQAQAVIAEEAYAVPIYVPRKIVGAIPEVHGWKFDAVGYTDSFYDTWKEQ
ncbi:MAG: ABC transporter substrate-binding protein [Bifidobacteriaceae bacterium]|nr:ABC transporter substrate-binding protein [Bifidobacteriaceae bacterium]